MQRDEALAHLRAMAMLDEAVPEWMNEMARWALEEIAGLEQRIAEKDAALEQLDREASRRCFIGEHRKYEWVMEIAKEGRGK